MEICQQHEARPSEQVKSVKDDEAIVIGHEAGKGKHVGKLGALSCKLRSGTTFKVTPARHFHGVMPPQFPLLTWIPSTCPCVCLLP